MVVHFVCPEEEEMHPSSPQDTGQCNIMEEKGLKTNKEALLCCEEEHRKSHAENQTKQQRCPFAIEIVEEEEELIATDGIRRAESSK